MKRYGTTAMAAMGRDELRSHLSEVRAELTRVCVSGGTASETAALSTYADRVNRALGAK